MSSPRLLVTLFCPRPFRTVRKLNGSLIRRCSGRIVQEIGRLGRWADQVHRPREVSGTDWAADWAAVSEAAQRVAGRLDLPMDWLNDAAKGYVHGLALGEVVFRADTLLVRTLSPAQLLAMKLCAWRDDLDIADARLLISKVQGGRQRIWEQVEPYLVPGRELKARYAFDDLWESEHET